MVVLCVIYVLYNIYLWHVINPHIDEVDSSDKHYIELFFYAIYSALEGWAHFMFWWLFACTTFLFVTYKMVDIV